MCTHVSIHDNQLEACLSRIGEHPNTSSMAITTRVALAQLPGAVRGGGWLQT